jgi:hypothetical protein
MVLLPVVSLNINYKKPARYDDLLTVKTIFKSQSTVKIEFDYEIYNEQRELLTSSILVLWIWKQVVRPFLRLCVWKDFENVIRKKKYLFFDFYVYFKYRIENVRKSFRHFFFRFIWILPIGNQSLH